MRTITGRTKHLLLSITVMIALLAPSTVAAADTATDVTATPTPVEQSRTPDDTPPDESEPVQPYIVQLRADVSVDRFLLDRRSALHDGPRQRFSSIINGFAVDLTPQGLAALESDARVVAIMPDFEVQAYNQTIPTGVRRVQAPASGAAKIDGIDDTMNIDVAVLDTGVGPHSDLRVAGGVNCVGGTSYSDDHGHGTHVAGTIAAIDNSVGVVGVAPGARIWSVKVLNSQGSGSGSSILCGIDWVTARAGTIKIANMSLGGVGYLDDNNCGYTNGDLIHRAICRSVAAGVTYTVAAGNDGKDAAQYFPANYDEVITVSALVDTDGLAGGLGASTSVGADDTLASFSNYGQDVDVIAPGVMIYSTARGGGYSTMSGTSMAAPHVAGAAALYKVVNPGATPADIRAALIAGGSSTGWSGDRDAFKEPLINVSSIGGGTTPPPPATIDAQVVSVSMPSSVTQGATATITVAVKNNGSASASISVALQGTPSGFSQTSAVTVASGQTSNVSFSWATTTSTATGTHTFTATSTLSGDSNAANNSASATTSVVAPATSSSMSVSNLSLTQTKLLTSTRLTSNVTIRSNGVAVSGAAVTVRFRYPNGSTYTMTANTNSSGVATFSRTVSAKGTYTVTVMNVTKSGSTYDAAGNTITSRSLTI
jgi:subtilisin